MHGLPGHQCDVYGIDRQPRLRRIGIDAQHLCARRWIEEPKVAAGVGDRREGAERELHSVDRRAIHEGDLTREGSAAPGLDIDRDRCRAGDRPEVSGRRRAHSQCRGAGGRCRRRREGERSALAPGERRSAKRGRDAGWQPVYGERRESGERRPAGALQVKGIGGRRALEDLASRWRRRKGEVLRVHDRERLRAHRETARRRHHYRARSCVKRHGGRDLGRRE